MRHLVLSMVYLVFTATLVAVSLIYLINKVTVQDFPLNHFTFLFNIFKFCSPE